MYQSVMDSICKENILVDMSLRARLNLFCKLGFVGGLEMKTVHSKLSRSSFFLSTLFNSQFAKKILFLGF